MTKAHHMNTNQSYIELKFSRPVVPDPVSRILSPLCQSASVVNLVAIGLNIWATPCKMLPYVGP